MNPSSPDSHPVAVPSADGAHALPHDGERDVWARPAVLDEPAPGVFDRPLGQLGFADPLRWLAAGWRDFLRAPKVGLFYGGCFAAMGWLLLTVFQHAPAYTLALSAGFLLVGPLLCLGLYDTSRKLERGETVRLSDSLFAWESRAKTLAIFGAVLLILEMLWARASLVVFALSFDGMPDFHGSVLKLLDAENLEFIIAYVSVGGIFAGWIFAVSVISMPMLLDREVDAITAGLTSIRLVFTQPGVMIFWGFLITLLIGLALLPAFLGLMVAGPVIGHATWHAYRAAVPRDDEATAE